MSNCGPKADRERRTRTYQSKLRSYQGMKGEVEIIGSCDIACVMDLKRRFVYLQVRSAWDLHFCPCFIMAISLNMQSAIRAAEDSGSRPDSGFVIREQMTMGPSQVDLISHRRNNSAGQSISLFDVDKEKAPTSSRVDGP